MSRLHEDRGKRLNSVRTIAKGLGLAVVLLALTGSSDSSGQVLLRADGQDEPEPAPELPEFDSWTRRTVALEAHLGLNGPLGCLGAALDVSVIPRWSIAAGAGVGIGGPQLAVMTRARLAGNARGAFFVESAFSGGNYRYVSIDQIANDWMSPGIAEEQPYDTDYVFRVAPAYWVHGALGYEARWEHLLLRGAGGLAFLLNRDDGACVGNHTGNAIPCDEAMSRFSNQNSGARTWVLPYAEFAIGYQLD